MIPKKSSIFHGDFHMEFCDDLSQLLEAYFRDFSIELLDRPWEAFTGSWSDVTLAKNLGLNSSFVEAGHCYILLRVSRYWHSGKMTDLGNPTLQEAVENQAKSVQVGDLPSVIEFVKRFGSHFISSYITGNSLFQVIVYSPDVYKKIKEKLQDSGISSTQHPELTSLFSPWYAEHLGLVLSASGNLTIAEWAKTTLRARSYFFPYISLLKLHGDSKLLKELDFLLGNEALLHLKLKTLSPVFTDERKKKWFEEVIDNNLKLWEVNL